VIGTALTEPQAVYYVNINSQEGKRLLKSSIQLTIPASLFSESQPITFPRCYGEDKVGSSYAIFVPPKNPGFRAPPGSKPPVILWMHGGLTTHVAPGLSLAIQYWTTRGYAYVCVNHAGSTSYGRAYRMLLQGEWGVIDIADAASCVSYLISQQLINGSCVGIIGESAGDYAVLQALCVYPDLWAGAVIYMG
jgi:dipeptidyl aminopeptidase/acylaminoacyl peptidase